MHNKFILILIVLSSSLLGCSIPVNTNVSMIIDQPIESITADNGDFILKKGRSKIPLTAINIHAYDNYNADCNALSTNEEYLKGRMPNGIVNAYETALNCGGKRVQVSLDNGENYYGIIIFSPVLDGTLQTVGAAANSYLIKIPNSEFQLLNRDPLKLIVRYELSQSINTASLLGSPTLNTYSWLLWLSSTEF